MNTELMRELPLAAPYFVVFLAMLTYWYNSRTKRAEFIYKLHTDFFVSETYKEVRKRLDCAVESHEDLRPYIEGEPEELIDYYNFFEMIAYLQKSGQLKKRDVNALFGYYLGCLKAIPAVRDYLRKEERSFENLSRMLNRLK